MTTSSRPSTARCSTSSRTFAPALAPTKQTAHGDCRSRTGAGALGAALRPPEGAQAPVPADRNDTGYLLAVASRRWNDILEQRFAEAGFPEVRASYGALLIPLFEQDAPPMGELARRSRLSKQTATT